MKLLKKFGFYHLLGLSFCWNCLWPNLAVFIYEALAFAEAGYGQIWRLFFWTWPPCSILSAWLEFLEPMTQVCDVINGCPRQATSRRVFYTLSLRLKKRCKCFAIGKTKFRSKKSLTWQFFWQGKNIINFVKKSRSGVHNIRPRGPNVARRGFWFGPQKPKINAVRLFA